MLIDHGIKFKTSSSVSGALHLNTTGHQAQEKGRKDCYEPWRPTQPSVWVLEKVVLEEQKTPLFQKSFQPAKG